MSDILNFIPPSLQQQILTTLVDFISDQAKKLMGDQIAEEVKKLRTDAAFRKSFLSGLDSAVSRFAEEYRAKDEDLVDLIMADNGFFKNEQVKSALLTLLKKPSAHLSKERGTLVGSFATVLPQRKNRERVNRAIDFLLECLTEELWQLPELQPVYSLVLQKATRDAAVQHLEVGKAQLETLVRLDADIRELLLRPMESVTYLRSNAKARHNLPQPEYGRFVGREEELAQVFRILRPYPYSSHALVTIDGVGGVGKSTLALEVAHRYLYNYDRISAEERFEAIVWTSAKQEQLTAEGIVKRHPALRTIGDVYANISGVLYGQDLTSGRSDQQAELWVRNALSQTRTLLIIDNLETIDDESVIVFLRELPAPTKAIVTTRHRIDVAYPVRLVGMSWKDAQSLIKQECSRKMVLISDDDTRQLYDRTGGIPLALVWCIAQIAFGYNSKTVLRRLGQPKGDVARFFFERAMDHIRGRPAHKLFLALAIVTSDVTNSTRATLGEITDLPELDRDDGLAELEKLSLINKEANAFSMLPLTHSFAMSELEGHQELADELARNWKAPITLEKMISPIGLEYRSEIIRPILSKVTSGESIAIVGTGSSAKSNLARHLLRADVRAHYMGAAAEHTLVMYLDCNTIADYTPAVIFLNMLDRLLQAVEGIDRLKTVEPAIRSLLREAQTDPGLLALRNLDKALSLLIEHDTEHILTVLDECDPLFVKAPPSLFRGLRAIRDNHRIHLVYLIITRRDPAFMLPMTSEYEGFFELIAAHKVAVTPYSEGDARQMIMRLAARQNPPHMLSESEVHKLFELSGGHAGLLRAIYFVTRESVNPFALDAIDLLVSKLDVQAECRKIWDSLEVAEQDALRDILNQSLPNTENLRRLQWRGLIPSNSKHTLRIFSPVFGRFLERFEAQTTSK